MVPTHTTVATTMRATTTSTMVTSTTTKDKAMATAGDDVFVILRKNLKLLVTSP